LGGDAKGMVKKLDTILSQTNELLADGKVVKQLKNTIQNADEMVATLHSMVGDNKENLRTLVKDLQGLAKEARAAINNNEPKVQSLLVKLDSLADSGKRLIAKTDTAVAGANGMISDTRSVISDIKTKDGFVNKLIYDGKLSNTLDSTLLIINSFLYKVHEHGLNANIRLGTRP
jgi:chemotaxis regulatin CheY-phosphate phosphatase CheZ